ncbi:NAD(P)-dependent oxidoreductase [Pseudoruegeria sp. HB172150]|uniref:NAD-dependent epimerase/dehydratase family protein n=1 Tax=Pseudoruegeria sp. HB172150 TaxID=2721164 RepID=UPI001C131DE9|nr:NAD(P)-dependent oxidoreductase [Pseudoruegeria sp. HB172150]
MKIAITGGNGRLGKVVVDLALKQGHEVVSIDASLPDQPKHHENLRYLKADCTVFDALLNAMVGCDAMIHLAAIPSPRQHPPHVVQNNNVTASFNAMQAAVQSGIRRICQASSVNALGLAFSRKAHFDYFPIDEAQPTRCEDPYSLSKWICEQQADAFVRLHDDLKIASLRFHYIVPEKSVARDAYLPRVEDADKHLWGYTLSDMAAEACLHGLTASFTGHEAFCIAAPDTVHDLPSLDLAQRYFPEVPIVGDLSGRNSFFSSEKARKILFGAN